MAWKRERLKERKIEDSIQEGGRKIAWKRERLKERKIEGKKERKKESKK